MHKWVMLGLMVIAGLLAVTLSITSIETKEETAEEAPKENEVRFEAENFKFDQEEYTIKAGEPMVLSMVNKRGGGIHAVEIEGTDIYLEDGDSVEHTFEPGTYEIKCAIMCGTGHDDMVSTLIVE
ncbi:hypothetical protein [Marinicrinis sediminis]|uniref:Cytochrome C oxidase subunit II n=1 Tax=Marinicrinis sediminis TaxID=1652465 RepID=A0ABW5RFL1_9BACL